MVELRREDPVGLSFRNIFQMPPEMFHKILTRITPRIVKEYTVRLLSAPPYNERK